VLSWLPSSVLSTQRKPEKEKDTRVSTFVGFRKRKRYVRVVGCVWETMTEQQGNSAKCQKKNKKNKIPDIIRW
jgi:hypothetical protein